jgi:tRNA(His) 5'-end guanylyltransferase
MVYHKMKDALGDRMKEFYEDRTRTKLPRRSYTIIRIDGKAFHTYTRGLERPFDMWLMEDMDATAAYLCKNIQGAKFAYVQSDEISILITDFDDLGTHAWFDNNLQKMASVSASMATAEFNRLRLMRGFGNYEQTPMQGRAIISQFNMAQFDARVFQIPFAAEVENYFIWRQQDATRNSISSAAQSVYSSKELHGVKTDGMQEMLFQKGINWNNYSPREKRGSLIRKVERKFIKSDSIKAVAKTPNTQVIDDKHIFTRSKWEADPETPIFTQDREYLRSFFPNYEQQKEEENV